MFLVKQSDRPNVDYKVFQLVRILEQLTIYRNLLENKDKDHYNGFQKGPFRCEWRVLFCTLRLEDI